MTRYRLSAAGAGLRLGLSRALPPSAANGLIASRPNGASPQSSRVRDHPKGAGLLAFSLKPRDVAVTKLRMIPRAVKSDAWFLYILRCSDGSLYAGITTDVKRRSEQHNAGTASRYTRSRPPVRLVYQEPHVSRSSASKRETQVKAMARSEKELLIRRAAQRRR